MKNIKARFYWDGTRRFSTNEEAFLFFNKVAEHLGYAECILSNALSLSADVAKMNVELQKYLDIPNIQYREFARHLLSGTIYSSLESNSLTFIDEISPIIKHGDHHVRISAEPAYSSAILPELHDFHPARNFSSLPPFETIG